MDQLRRSLWTAKPYQRTLFPQPGMPWSQRNELGLVLHSEYVLPLMNQFPVVFSCFALAAEWFDKGSVFDNQLRIAFWFATIALCSAFAFVDCRMRLGPYFSALLLLELLE